MSQSTRWMFQCHSMLLFIQHTDCTPRTSQTVQKQTTQCSFPQGVHSLVGKVQQRRGHLSGSEPDTWACSASHLWFQASPSWSVNWC